MLESILFLAAGILFLMFVLACLGRRADGIRCFVMAVSVFFVMYTVIASVLITLEQFSVNRSIMLVTVISFIMAAAAAVIYRKQKPSWSLNLKRQIIPVIICVVFAVIGIGVTNDGFFGMDSTIGISQAKAINLASGNETSPFEAEYITALDNTAYSQAEAMLAPVAGKYEGYNVFLTSLLAFGTYFFGYNNMSFVLILIGMCILYIFWCFLSNVGFKTAKRRRIGKLLAEAALMSVFVLIIWLMFGGRYERAVLRWDSLNELRAIISKYDIVVIDEDIMEKYYVPVAGVTGAKVYPCYADISDVIDDVSANGERLYYLRRGVISSDAIDSMGLNLKNVHRDGEDVLYRNLNFYQTHKDFDYAEVKEKTLTAVLMLLAILAFLMFFAGIFKRFDVGLNLLLSSAVSLGIYALVSWLLIELGAFTIAYAAAVTMAVALTAWAAVIYSGAKMQFPLKLRKSLVPFILCILILAVSSNRLDGGLYASYRSIGRSQLWALEYIYDSRLSLEALEQIPALSSLMALFGLLFGEERMIMVLPSSIACCVTLMTVLLERLASAVPVLNKSSFRRTACGTIISAVTALAALSCSYKMLDIMSEKKPIASWKNIFSYAAAVEPDDSIAIQRSMYDTYHYPLRIITGVSTCLRSIDYNDAAQKLDNTGKDTFYLSPEVIDASFERVKVMSHDGGAYMYKIYDYLTRRGIYSVTDSVTEGFHSIETSGMAWTSEHNSFIQCDIPYRKYNTVRLYLGSEVKLDEINIGYIDIEFRENWYYVDEARLDADNNGKYIDFKLDWTYMIDGYNVIYFHSGAMWSPLIYGDKDTRVMGFPFHYIQFLYVEEEEGTDSGETGSGETGSGEYDDTDDAAVTGENAMAEDEVTEG